MPLLHSLCFSKGGLAAYTLCGEMAAWKRCRNPLRRACSGSLAVWCPAPSTPRHVSRSCCSSWLVPGLMCRLTPVCGGTVPPPSLPSPSRQQRCAECSCAQRRRGRAGTRWGQAGGRRCGTPLPAQLPLQCGAPGWTLWRPGGSTAICRLAWLGAGGALLTLRCSCCLASTLGSGSVWVCMSGSLPAPLCLRLCCRQAHWVGARARMM